MRKWWWWWLPGWHKKWKLQSHRIEALSSIAGERLYVERMAQRPRPADDILDRALLADVLKQLNDLQEKARSAVYKDDLDDLIADAELQGLFAAYFCPAIEISIEGDSAIDLIEGWGIPKIAVTKLRDSLSEKLASADPLIARKALYAIFTERDSWDDYIDEYEETAHSYTRGLFAAIIALPLIATLALRFASWFSPFLVLGFLCAGGAGSCVSIMSKLPSLPMSLAGELEAYGRRVFSRIGVGLLGSLIGCALLAWIPISIQTQTFADAVNSCTTAPCTAPAMTCTSIKLLILVGVPMLLGFSERTLTLFEQRVFGDTPAIRRKSNKG